MANHETVLKVLHIADAEAGTHEIGGNDCGPRIKEYLASVGLPEGNPFCASFVHWCFEKAGIAWPKTGDTWALQTWARDHGCYTLTPSHGDVFLLIGGDGNPEHTGFVEKVNGDNTVGTIEANTHQDGAAGGPKGVFHKTRGNGFLKFIHWPSVL